MNAFSDKLFTATAAVAAVALHTPDTNSILQGSMFGVEVIKPLFVPAAIAVAAAPDMDLKQVEKLKWVPKFIRNFIGLVHRGYSHYLIIPGILLLGAIQTGEANITWISGIMLGMCFGWLSHLLTDAVTKWGVPILGPFIKCRYSFMRISSNGGLSEYFGLLIIMSLLLGHTFQIMMGIKL